MGQHKYNPTAIAAKNGELPPKPKPMSKRQREALLYAKIREVTGITELEKKMRGEPYVPFI